MKINQTFMKRNVAGEILLVPVGESCAQFKGVITLNQTAEFLWEHLSEASCDEALVQILLDAYEVEREVAQRDVERFLARLRELSII